MIRLLSKITKYNSNTHSLETVGYLTIEDGQSQTKAISKSNVIKLADKNMVHNVVVDSRHRLRGINGFKITELNKISYNKLKNSKIKEKTSNISVLTKGELRNFINKGLNGIEKHRFIYYKLIDYMYTSDLRVCSLYGLRRTGKTVMLMQTAKDLLQGNKNVAIINCTDSTDLRSLLDAIKDLIKRGYTHILIDEITYVYGFIQNSNMITDVFAKQGVKFVLTGTHSLALSIAENTYMYDRVYRIDTSYISFKEHNYIFGTTNILDYIKSGGLMSKSLLYTKDKVHSFINTTIIDNIIQSIRKDKYNNRYTHLVDADNRGLLGKLINQAIESSNDEITLNAITKEYESNYYGSAKQLMESKLNIDNIINKEDVIEHLRYYLGIVRKFDTDILEEYRDELVDILREINVLDKYTKLTTTNFRRSIADVFIQPGLRNRQMIELIRAINDNTIIDKDIKDFILKLVQSVQGSLIEEVVILDELNRFREANGGIDNTDDNILTGQNKDLFVQINANGPEIDMLVVKDGLGTAYEIKRSDKAVEKQARWLTNTKFINSIEDKLQCKIINKVVLYNGEDKSLIINNETIQYKNITKFLLR